MEGVRRVVARSEQRKLSIFYMETVCDAHQVVRKLAQLVDLLVEGRFVTPEGAPIPPPLHERIRSRVSGPFKEWKNRVSAWKAQARTAKTMLDVQWKVNPALRVLGDDPEKAILGFINDAVTFYLIKVHWDMIIRKWLKSPLRHRYEWLTAFYFIFLLVRSRKK
jgi:hypothetical protein